VELSGLKFKMRIENPQIRSNQSFNTKNSQKSSNSKPIFGLKLDEQFLDDVASVAKNNGASESAAVGLIIDKWHQGNVEVKTFVDSAIQPLRNKQKSKHKYSIKQLVKYWQDYAKSDKTDKELVEKRVVTENIFIGNDYHIRPQLLTPKGNAVTGQRIHFVQQLELYKEDSPEFCILAKSRPMSAKEAFNKEEIKNINYRLFNSIKLTDLKKFSEA